MVKHTQTILRLLPKNCLSVSDHFVGLTLKGFNDTTENVTGEMILGIVIENKLNFKFYLKMYAKRLAKKLTLKNIKLTTFNHGGKWQILSLTLNFPTVLW